MFVLPWPMVPSTCDSDGGVYSMKMRLATLATCGVLLLAACGNTPKAVQTTTTTSEQPTTTTAPPSIAPQVTATTPTTLSAGAWMRQYKVVLENLIDVVQATGVDLGTGEPALEEGTCNLVVKYSQTAHQIPAPPDARMARHWTEIVRLSERTAAVCAARPRSLTTADHANAKADGEAMGEERLEFSAAYTAAP